MKLPLPIGNSDYKETSSENYYVDKTLFIKELLDENPKIILFTRPRRFGKTLNMDMLRTFFEKTAEDNSVYFTKMKIWQQGSKYTEHQGKYPVIFLSLKDARGRRWETAYEMLKYIIRTEYSRHGELEASNEITLADRIAYNKIIMDTASDSYYLFSLQALSRMLYAHYKTKPIIIIDEYDTPVQEGHINGYYDEAIEFVRTFLSAGLKDNPNIMMSVLTGILRIAKESIFSGLNSVRVFSVLDHKFSSYFGFTADEIEAMAGYYGGSEKTGEIKEWYDGYKFGNQEIYNPWSVLNYFGNDCIAMPYWVQTSENAIIREILKSSDEVAYQNLTDIMTGRELRYNIKTNIIYPRLKEPQADILGFLLMTGYLKAAETMLTAQGTYQCKLKIPNKELKTVYYQEILTLITQGTGESTIRSLQAALLNNDAVKLKETLSDFMAKTISCFDGLRENYYHGLVLGLITVLEANYYLHSNRESGNGRYDIQLEPKNLHMPGIIIELKAAEKSSGDSLKSLAQTALEQIIEKKYDTELHARGIKTIYKYGVAFCNKDAEVVSA